MKKEKLNKDIKRLKKLAGLINENESFDKKFLKLGEYYQVYDPGMDEFNDEFEYVGFDINSKEYIFKAYAGPTDLFMFVGVPKSELNTDVRPSEL